MPYPVNQEQTLQAVNDVLATMVPKGHIDSLDTDKLSDKSWSCNFFAPSLLVRICEITGFKESNIKTTEYKAGDELPFSFNDRTFVNISMMGGPSTLNHNFNILVSDKTIFLIQVYLDKEVPIVQQFTNDEFMTNWKNISDNTGWAEAYETLFRVKPDPAGKIWMEVQYVSL